MRYVTGSVRIVAAVVGLLILAMAVVAFPYAWRAATGDGIRGSFTAERRDCSSRGCAHYGTWRATPPETQVVHGALMDEWPTDSALGSSVEAVYLGEVDPAVVYPATDSLAWLYVLVVAGGAVVLIAGVWTGLSLIRAERGFARRSRGYEPRRAKHEPGP